MRDRDVSKLKDLLGPVGRHLRLDDPLAAAALWRRWPEIVGEDIARNAEPTSLKDGLLRIRTATPVWATEISYLKEDIKGRVNEALKKPLVRDVAVWTSPAPIAPRRDSGPGRQPDARTSKEGVATDPQTAFERAFRAWSERRSRGRS